MSRQAHTEYWFARRYPFGSGRDAMAPVHWKGWAMAWVFVLILLAGALLFAWFGANGQIVKGAACFIVASLMGMVWFIGISRRKGDLIRTVAEYKKERARA